VLFEPAESRRVVQLTAEQALEDAEMRGGAERQGAQTAPKNGEKQDKFGMTKL